MEAEHALSSRASSSRVERVRVYGEDEPQLVTHARRLELIPTAMVHIPDDWYLARTNGELELRHPTRHALRLPLEDIERRVGGGRTQALAKACGSRPGLRVLDALAGWGTDGLTLAGLGCAVTMVEAQPMVCAMLADRVNRSTIAGTGPVDVICGEAAAILEDSQADFDVIYIDPMFPPHPKTAKPSYRMQVLAELGLSTDVENVVRAALRRATERVVVKIRASQKPELGLGEPSWQIRSKSVRFDVYRT